MPSMPVSMIPTLTLWLPLFVRAAWSAFTIRMSHCRPDSGSAVVAGGTARGRTPSLARAARAAAGSAFGSSCAGTAGAEPITRSATLPASACWPAAAASKPLPASTVYAAMAGFSATTRPPARLMAASAAARVAPSAPSTT